MYTVTDRVYPDDRPRAMAPESTASAIHQPRELRGVLWDQRSAANLQWPRCCCHHVHLKYGQAGPGSFRSARSGTRAHEPHVPAVAHRQAARWRSSGPGLCLTAALQDGGHRAYESADSSVS